MSNIKNKLSAFNKRIKKAVPVRFSTPANDERVIPESENSQAVAANDDSAARTDWYKAIHGSES